jgi:hypothetical protein
MILKRCAGFIFLLSLFLPEWLYAQPYPAVHKITHVIYVTLDGTRWQDVFRTHQYLRKFWNNYAAKAKTYGAPGSRTIMETASIPVSLPSYQSQMSGNVQPCDGNECGRITVQTLPEVLVHKYKFSKKDVAIFSSWSVLEHAAESIKGTAFVNAGNFPVSDPVSGKPDAVMSVINKQQSVDHVQKNSDRYDRYTFAQALHYYYKYQPRFMWISLQDTDEAAHDGNREEYYQALTFYDTALDRLFAAIKKSGKMDSTMVIVTTDHGRGNGVNWTEHGPKFPESRRTWAFVINGELSPVRQNGKLLYYSTLSVRPSLEAVFSQCRPNGCV